MTQDEIIEIARDADWGHASANLYAPALERFAKLVAAKEREACIEIAEKQRYAMHISLTSHPPQNGTAVGIANQIRARGASMTPEERVKAQFEQHDKQFNTAKEMTNAEICKVLRLAHDALSISSWRSTEASNRAMDKEVL